MPPALWLVALPLGGVPLVYLLRRMKAGAIVAALITLLAAWLAVRLPTGVVASLLGRTIELDRLAQLTLGLVFLSTAVLFLILVLTQRGPRATTRPGRTAASQEGRIFYPSALVILGLFVAASLSRHLGITAILIELAAIVAVFVIQTERLESTRAAFRFLILISLATPLFLLAAWHVDQYQLSGGFASSRTLNQATLLIGVGFAVWLGVVPFHGWLTSTAIESLPSTAAFVLISFPIVAISTLLHLLVELPWLTDALFLVDAIIIAGVFTAFIGGLWSSVQRGFSELMGYTAMYDLGCTLVVLGLGGRAAVITILVALTARALALILIAASLSAIRLRIASVGFAEVKGIAYQMPAATVGLLVGGLSLAGAPFTAGFAPHWQMLQSMAEIDWRWLTLLIVGGLGVTVGYLRGLRSALQLEGGVRGKERRPATAVPVTFEEPWPVLIIVVLLAGISVVLGFFPGLLIEPLQAAAKVIPFPLQ